MCGLENAPVDQLKRSSGCAAPHGQDARPLYVCMGKPPGLALRHPRSGWQRGVGASSAPLPPHRNEHWQGFHVDIISREVNKETPSPDVCWLTFTCHPRSGHFQLRQANASPNPPSSPHLSLLPISPISPYLPPPLSPTSPLSHLPSTQQSGVPLLPLHPAPSEHVTLRSGTWHHLHQPGHTAAPVQCTPTNAG